MADVTEYTNARKPHDLRRRPFHRIGCLSYDRSVDQPGVPALGIPPGTARKSGARGPEDFVGSGLTKKIAKAMLDGIQALLHLIPVVNVILLVLEGINEAVDKLAHVDLIGEAKDKLATLIGQAFEAALFDQYMRAIPAWVPVGRVGYARDRFVYPDHGGERQASVEEEREVEGLLTASYQTARDIPHTQWTRYSHWSFHVQPLPGYRRVIGAGNIPHRGEDTFILSASEQTGTARFSPVVDLYGQVGDPGPRPEPGRTGSIECLMDVGAFSRPPGDGGSHGVMFGPEWPFWPMTGDHFWAVGRWVYEATRVVQPVRGGDELFPTQINPIKAFAVARFEGFRFPENPGPVPAVRFLFFACSEGGYLNFREETDRDGKKHPAPITLRDRDYQFIVDLPVKEGGKTPYPIGATTEFMRNTLVIRPRLLMQIQFAPFSSLLDATDRWVRGTRFHEVMPTVELIRPDDPTRPPTQARVTVPMSRLPDRKPAPEVYGFDLRLGWHDAEGVDARDLVEVELDFASATFEKSSDPIRLKTCINGRWRVLSNQPRAGERFPIGHREILHLPRDAPMAVAVHGTYRHGFGEYLEGKPAVDEVKPDRDRRLKVGGIIAVKKEYEEELERLRQIGGDAARIQFLSEEIERLNDLLEVLSEFIGQPHTPDWVSDIDAERKQGEEEKRRVSAIARELWVRPAPIITRADAPIGWVEGIDDGRLKPPSFHVRAGSTPEWDLISTPERLLKFLAGKPETRVRFEGNWFVHVGAGGNLARQINRTEDGVLPWDTGRERLEYRIDLKVKVTPPQ